MVFTGDIHSSWGVDLSRAPTDPLFYDSAAGTGTLGVEFVTPGVTSPAGDTALTSGVIELIDWDALAPHIRYKELLRRGYLIIDVSRTRVQGAWFHFETVESPDVESTFTAAYSTAVGENHLVPDAEAAPGPAIVSEPAP